MNEKCKLNEVAEFILIQKMKNEERARETEKEKDRKKDWEREKKDSNDIIWNDEPSAH